MLQRLNQPHLTTTGHNDGKGDWVNVTLPRIRPNNDPIFVVNIGDCLSDLTGGMLPSTLHRVMPWRGGGRPSPSPRNCLAMFVGLDPEEQLMLPSSGEQLSYEEWRKQRISRA